MPVFSHNIKTRQYMRQISLHWNVLRLSRKFGTCGGHIKREISVKKIKVEKIGKKFRFSKIHVSYISYICLKIQKNISLSNG